MDLSEFEWSVSSNVGSEPVPSETADRHMARMLARLPRAKEPSASLSSSIGVDDRNHACIGPTVDTRDLRVFDALHQGADVGPKGSWWAGRSIGRYAVLESLGRGGMGAVYKAYDPQLDRAVAIKVLHAEVDQEHTARLRREAQALAKLSHPNVVQVYEVGEADGQTFIAMELVRGQTLRTWMEESKKPRSWQECVNVYLQAGAGLAAAHEAGLVHRDFKPDNVIIDAKGQVRVLDFGLARWAVNTYAWHEDDRPADLDAKNIALEASLTQSGTILGTPLYMPPEQWHGEDAGARSDQFSFCVALYEALYGQRPFAIETIYELMGSDSWDAKARIQRPEAGKAAVPFRLRQVVLRGLAHNPEQRWPSMGALLVELRRLAVPRGFRVIARGLAVGLAAVAASMAFGYYLQVKERCTGARAHLDGVWDDSHRRRVRGAILGTELSFAPDTWERIEVRLDDYARAWEGKYTEVCEATSVRDEQTKEAMDLRMACLHDRKSALGAAVRVLVDADDTVVEKAVPLIEALPSMDRCDDLDWLQQLRQRVPPPEDPRVAHEVDVLRRQLVSIKAEREAGRYADALKHLESVVQRAKTLGYEPLLAKVLLERGRAREQGDDFIDAERDLERAFMLAADHGHDALVANAAISLVSVVGTRQERHELALVWGKMALALSLGPEIETTAEANALENIGLVLQHQDKLSEALAHLQQALVIKEQELGKNHTAVAKTLSNIGTVFQQQDKLSEALNYHRQALSILEQILGENHTSVAMALNNIGIVMRRRGKLSEALTYLERALAIQELAWGKDHTYVAKTLGNIGTLLMDRGESSAALTCYQRALAIFEQAFGENHIAVARTLVNIGIVLIRQGKSSEALIHCQRALAIEEQVLGKRHTSVAIALGEIGVALMEQGKLSEALTNYQRALDIFEHALGEQHTSVAIALSNIGIVLMKQGQLVEAMSHFQRASSIEEEVLDPNHIFIAKNLVGIGTVLIKQGKEAEAKGQFQRALAIFEQRLGPDHPDIAYPLIGLAKIALNRREFATARTHAERAVSVREAGQVVPTLLALARFTLARSLWNDRTERKRARVLAQKARDAFSEYGEGREDDVAEIDAWLAKHRTRSPMHEDQTAGPFGGVSR
ncbi:MAG: tetratricopeptide repeat protein [Myxococcota bacterium]